MRRSARHNERLGGCLLHPGLQPAQLNGRFAVTPGNDVKKFAVAERRAGLFDHGPGYVDEARQEVDVLEVPQQAHRTLPRCGQPFGVESFGFII
jgi:hypothetical protein